MKVKSAILVVLVVALGFLYLNPPDSYEASDLLRAALNRANLTINYCLCQDFGHKEYGKMGSVYVAIHITLFFWWFYEVLKADRLRVRRSEKQQQKEIRRQLRLLRLHAWLHDAYPPVPARYDYAFAPFAPEHNFEPTVDAQQDRREDTEDESEEPQQSVSSQSYLRFAFPRLNWRSQSAPP